MAPPAKTAEGRRKSGGKPTLIVTLAVTSSRLRDMLKVDSGKDETPSAKDVPPPKDAKVSPPGSAAPASSIAENASDSNAATPAADTASAMGPPAEGPKKKGTKRSAAGANGPADGSSKPRGKPGPKKKPRLEDGTIDPTSNRTGGGHKLGPKANQGAINAGLRALDRTGKPCRKWAIGGFSLKSFTGVVWEVSRWKAPPKTVAEPANDDSAVPSADNSSSKENKENGVEVNSGSNSNSGADVEMRSANSVPASSPAPMAVTAAT